VFLENEACTPHFSAHMNVFMQKQNHNFFQGKCELEILTGKIEVAIDFFLEQPVSGQKCLS
jgi:hypothetical protein